MLGVHNRVSAAAAMQARAFNDDTIDTYLPGILEERRAKPILRRSFNALPQISYRRQG